MNLHIFFILIFSMLMAIYLFFKPMHLKEQEFIDVPLFELSHFTLYELNPTGLAMKMSGKSAIRYSDRYTLQNIKFTDSSKKDTINIKADKALYKDNLINLWGDIHLDSDNGMVFTTQHAIYDKEKNILTTDTPYILSQFQNVLHGNSLKYYHILDKIESKDIEIRYQLQEKIK